MSNELGMVLKEACDNSDIHTIHRIISEMNMDGAFDHWRDIANGFFNLDLDDNNKFPNLCNELLRTIRNYLYDRPVDANKKTNLALQILQMMLCGSEANPWPRLQYETY